MTTSASSSTVTLVAGGGVLTADPAGTVYPDGAVLVQGGRITAVGTRRDVETALVTPPDRLVDARGGVIAPGLVDAHVHLVESLLRHLPGDIDLPSWVRTRLRPYEADLTPDTATAAAELALLELTLAGVTTVGESMLPDGELGAAVAAAAERSGLRVHLAVAVGGPHDAEGTSGYEGLAADWHGCGDRISVGLAPRPLPQIAPQFLAEVATYARSSGVRMTSHFANSEAQHAWIASELGATPGQAAAELGLLWDGHQLGHCTWLGQGDVRLIGASGASIAHLPVTNLRLGMGLMPLVELRAAGVPVGIGTDGDNIHDLFAAARLAADIQRMRRGPTAMSAQAVLDMLTIEGARSLGLDSELGSIEIGKRADLIVVGADAPHLAPRPDPLHLLARAARPADVRSVLVGGELVIDDGCPTRLDASAVTAEATKRSRFPRGGRP
ncbi:amidohydrolase family protein [Streptomyces umbrinus]|uniref:amidohydrolase family protein n=1 Tax=Streptomyces umbrinus TaxID=67370 RepID=UPI0034030EB1